MIEKKDEKIIAEKSSLPIFTFLLLGLLLIAIGGALLAMRFNGSLWGILLIAIGIISIILAFLSINSPNAMIKLNGDEISVYSFYSRKYISINRRDVQSVRHTFEFGSGFVIRDGAIIIKANNIVYTISNLKKVDEAFIKINQVVNA